MLNYGTLDTDGTRASDALTAQRITECVQKFKNFGVLYITLQNAVSISQNLLCALYT